MLVDCVTHFIVFGKELARTYYIENGMYMLSVRCRKTGIRVINMQVPKIQFEREYELYLKRKSCPT